MEDLRTYLDQEFRRLHRRLDAADQNAAALRGEIGERAAALRGEMGELAAALRGEIGERAAALRGEIGAKIDELRRETRVLIEDANRNIFKIADGHMLLYEGMTRRHEEIRNDMAEIRGLLNIWKDLVRDRLKMIEQELERLKG